MRRKQLKGTDLLASCICLGTDDFGTGVEKQRAFDVMDAYFESGGNVLDTARVYAAWFPNGEGKSEETVGEWLKNCQNRNQIILSSKCGHPPIGKMEQSRLSEEEIESDLDKSLIALGVDHIDFMWLHRDDKNKPVSEIMEAINKMIQKGKVRYFGVSNWNFSRINDANEYADKNGLAPFVASQIKWSYAVTNPNYSDDPTLVEMNDAEKSFYQQKGIPVFAYASQAKGFFSKYQKNGAEGLSQKAKERYYCEENVRRYKKANQIARDLGVPISSVILAYITSRSDIQGFAIAGCKNVEQLKDSVCHSDLILTKEKLDFLEGESENTLTLF